MIVSNETWHYKAWRFMQLDHLSLPDSVTFCNYWSTIIFSLPFFCVLVAVLGPIFWVADKIATWLEEFTANKSLCPFGKVEFKDHAAR